MSLKITCHRTTTTSAVHVNKKTHPAKPVIILTSNTYVLYSKQGTSFFLHPLYHCYIHVCAGSVDMTVRCLSFYDVLLADE